MDQGFDIPIHFQFVNEYSGVFAPLWLVSWHPEGLHENVERPLILRLSKAEVQMP